LVEFEKNHLATFAAAAVAAASAEAAEKAAEKAAAAGNRNEAKAIEKKILRRSGQRTKNTRSICSVCHR
jgi:cytochrome c5